MRRPVEDLAHLGVLDDPARIHHGDVVAHPGDDPEIMGDEEEREIELPLQRAQEVEVLRLDRGIERGRRLVGDQELGPARDGDRAHHALAHAAAELVGIVPHAHLGRGNAHAPQALDHACELRLAGQALMNADGFADLDSRC